MFKNKLKDIQKQNPNIKDNISINIKYQGIKKLTNIDNIKIAEKIQKKNLPELKLTKLKSRPDSDSENEFRGKSINNTNIQMNIKNPPNIPKKKKSHSLMKKNALVFPKINSNINEIDYLDKKFPIKNNNIPKKKNQKIGINNITHLQGLKSDKRKDFDVDKNDNKNKNESLNIQKIKTKMKPNNNNNIKSIHQTKLKALKKDHSNIETTLIPNTFHPFQSNHLIQNKLILPSNNNSTNTNYNKVNSIIPPSTISNGQQTSSSSTSMTNELKELELMTEKLNFIHNLFNTLPFSGINSLRKEVTITPEIFKNTYKNFEMSIISTDNDINEKDIIKGYAYNSSMGNVRDYNEDTITATKISLNNNNEDDYFYFFGVYDGHGGKGCSFYLKENLHKNVKEFSVNGIKLAIEQTEEDFKKNEALNENEEIKDSSGSCAIILMIKGNKSIIANVGDSRLVIFKNGAVSFQTEDHKPGTEKEKKRIELAGGKIYQTPSLFPLFQNGKEIEIPWRVLPGRLSVSRTFGDIEAKSAKFGGMQNVVVALPDITEIELNDEYNFIVIGCDGIFDVLSNEELLDCLKIVLKEKKIDEFINNDDIHEICGDFAAMIIKSALAKDSFDNVSCIVIALNLNKILPIAN
jgi:serine/threonine protein phosphatase PrpC